MTTESEEQLVHLTADIVAAHVSNNSVSVGDLATLIGNVHAALAGLGNGVAAPDVTQAPAVTVRASVKPDAITCLECGFKGKMIKRHLDQAHALSPSEYRAKWKLPPDYPMTAPNYAAQRKKLALKIGLGKKGSVARKGGVKKAP